MQSADSRRCDRKRIAEPEEDIPRKKLETDPEAQPNYTISSLETLSKEEKEVFIELLQHGFSEIQVLDGLKAFRGSELSFEQVMIHIVSQLEVRLLLEIVTN